MGRKRICGGEADKIAAIANDYLRFKRQFAQQDGAKMCLRSGSANYKGACRTYAHNVVGSEFFCKDARAESPVSAHIYTSQENDQAHAEIITDHGHYHSTRYVGLGDSAGAKLCYNLRV